MNKDQHEPSNAKLVNTCKGRNISVKICNSNISDSEACNSGSDVDDCGSTASVATEDLHSSSLVESCSGLVYM